MKTLLLLLLVFAGLESYSQAKILKRDTINLRGYVYHADGSPAKNVLIGTHSKDLVHNYNFIHTYCDTSGYFELKGIKPDDTIWVRGGLKIPVRGSRYIVATLPYERTRNLNSLNITAVRIKPKKTPTFEIKDTTVVNQPEIFGGYENSAEFPGGLEKFQTLVQKQLHYPQQAIAKNIEGTVEVEFIVGIKGLLQNIRLIKGLGYGCDEEVITLIKNSPKWKPAIYYGQPVEDKFSLAIEFKLTDNQP